MKNVKRFLALLLAVLMVSGNVISAAAVDAEMSAEIAESTNAEPVADTASAAADESDTSDTYYNSTETPAEEQADADEAAVVEEVSFDDELTVAAAAAAEEDDNGEAKTDENSSDAETVITLKVESPEAITYGDADPEITVTADIEVEGVSYKAVIEDFEREDFNTGEKITVRPANEEGYEITAEPDGELPAGYKVECVPGILIVNRKPIAKADFKVGYNYDTKMADVDSVDPTLKAGIDYTYTDNRETKTVTITGVGNYTGEVTETYTIEEKKYLSDCKVELVDLPAEGYIYDGTAHIPAVKVTDAEGVELVEGKDYVVSVLDAVSAGTVAVYVVRADGSEYIGSGIAKDEDGEIATYEIARRPVVIEVESFAIPFGTEITSGDLHATVLGKPDAGVEVQYALETEYKAGERVGEYTITANTKVATRENWVWPEPGEDGLFDEDANEPTVETENYDPNDNYLITVDEGIITVFATDREVAFEAKGYEEPYDGEEHTVTIVAQEAGDKITYSTDGEEFVAEAPVVKDVTAEPVTVWIRVENDRYAGMNEGGYAEYTVTLNVTPAVITASTTDSVVEEGEEIIPGVTTVSFGEETVTFNGLEGAEIALANGETGVISIECKETDEVGVYKTELSLTVEGNSAANYEFDYTAGTVTVKGAPVATVTDESLAELAAMNVTYDGKEHKWNPVLVSDGEKLTSGVDYSVSYNRKSFADAKDYTVTIDLLNGYIFEDGATYKDYTYTIAKRSLPFVPVMQGSPTGYALNEVGENKYEVTMTFEANKALPAANYLTAQIPGLEEGESAPYTVNFIKDGSTILCPTSMVSGYTYANYDIPAVEITLKTVAVNIEDNSNVEAVLAKPSYIYTGSEIKPAVTVTYKGVELVKGTDYEVDFANNVYVGAAEVIISGLEPNFTGEISVPFAISQAALAIVPDSGDFTYNGEVQIPGVTVLFAGKSMKFDYADSISADLGNGDTATLTRYYSIMPKDAGTHQNVYNVIVTNAKGEDVTGCYEIENDKSVTFNIAKADLSEDDVKVVIADTEYGTELAPETEVLVAGNIYLRNVSYHYATADGVAIDGEPTEVGEYTVYATWADTTNYNDGKTKAVTFQITPKDVTVTADAKSKVYGDADPELDYSVEGLAYSDSKGVISVSLTREAGENAGEYTITAAGEENQGNYKVAFENGVFTIERRDVTVTADAKTKTYGDADPELTYTTEGTLGADTVSATVTREVGENVGDYALTVTGDAAQGNYAVSFESDAALTIAKRPATIYVPDQTVSYGAEAPTVWNETVSNVVEGESLDYTIYTNYTENCIAGTYPIKVVLGDNPNYDVTVSAGNVIANPAGRNISVTGGESEYTYDGVTSHDFQVSGLLRGDRISYTVGSKTYSDYVSKDGEVLNLKGGIIHAGTAELKITVTNSNYADFNGSYTLTVKPATLTVTTASATKSYDGTALTAPEGSIEGLVNGETAELSVTGSQTEAGSSDNTFEIIWNGTALESDYAVTAKLGTLTVSSVDFTVAKPANVVYNGQSQQQPVTVSAADYDVIYSEDTVNAGTVTVTVIGKGNNAGFTHNTTYTINPAPLTITTASASKTYDGTALTAAGSIEGLVNGETATLSTASITNVGSARNTYAIAWGTAKEGNYTVASANIGTLTVTSRTMQSDAVVIADAPTYTYNGAEHQWTPVVRLAGGRTLVEGTDYYVTYSTDDLRSAGTVTVTIHGIGNFSGSASVAYTISRATLTVTTASASKTYDGTALTAGGSVSGLATGDTVSFSATGSQTEIGSSVNTYSLIWNGTARAANYTVAENLGTLTVNPVAAVADEEETAEEEELANIEEDAAPLAAAPKADYSLTEDGAVTTLEEDDTPLAASPLSDADCVMHFLLLVAALAVAAYYGFTRKKHQDLEKKLQDEISKS